VEVSDDWSTWSDQRVPGRHPRFCPSRCPGFALGRERAASGNFVSGIVGLSALRVFTNRFRAQAGLGWAGLFPQHDVVKKSDEKSNADGPLETGAGAYAAAIFDVAHFEGVWLNVHARFSVATFDTVDVKAMSVQLGVSR
jgi:hypothetical protein